MFEKTWRKTSNSPSDRNVANDVFSDIPAGCVRAPYASVLNVRMFHVCVISCVGLGCVVGGVSVLRGYNQLMYYRRSIKKVLFT